MTKTIAVVGATGNQGGSVIKNLLLSSELYGWKIRGITRDPTCENAKKLAEQGVEMVACNLDHLEQVKEAFKGCFGVFGVTLFNLENPEQEFVHGKNMVDAAVYNGVQHFLFSSLEDVDRISNGDLSYPIFSNKNRVEQYARKISSSIPFTTFVYAPAYFQNIPHQFKLNEDKKSATIVGGLYPNKKTPHFSVHDTGIVVAHVFKHPELYNQQKVLAANEYLSYGEVAEICSRVLNIPTQYVELHGDVFKFNNGLDLNPMYDYFNKYGYFQENEKEAVEKTRELFPNMLTFEMFVQQNKHLFLKDSQ